MKEKALFVALVLSLSSGPLVRTRADDRVEQPGPALERLGARTGLSAQAVWPNLTAEAKKLQRQNKYALIVIGEDWKGGVKGLNYLKAQPGVRGVMFSHPDFSDDWVRCLEEMKDLKYVYVYGERFTDKGLKSLRHLRDLEALSLLQTSITDKGLACLEGMTKLRWLSLCLTPVTGDGMVHLRRATELRWLNLDGTDVVDDGIAPLKNATKMEWLRLSGHPAGKAGLKHLAEMRNLKALSIGSLITSEDELKKMMDRAKGLEYIGTSDGVWTREGWKEGPSIEENLRRVRQRIRDNIEK